MIKVNAIIEIVGAPKEHVTEVIDKAVQLMKENENFKLLNAEKSEPKTIPQSEKIFSSFVEAELSFSNFEKITGFCLDFMPSSIEIVEPEKITVDTLEMTNTLNDLMAKLHQYDMTLKNYILKEKASKSKKED